MKSIYIACLFTLFTIFSNTMAASYGLSPDSSCQAHQPADTAVYTEATQLKISRPLNPEAKPFIPKDISTLAPEERKYIIEEAFRKKDTETLEKLGFTIGPDNELWHLAVQNGYFPENIENQVLSVSSGALPNIIYSQLSLHSLLELLEQNSVLLKRHSVRATRSCHPLREII